MTCPITREHFVDPVFCVGDGHTFERSAIESWFERNDTSPITGATLACKVLVPNFQARRLADETRAASFLGRSTRASEPHPGAPAGPLRLAFSRGHRRGHPLARRPSTRTPRRVRHRRRGPRRRQRHVRPRRHLSGRARLQTRRVSSDASPIRRRTRLVGRLGDDEKTRSRRERPPGRHLLPRAKLRVFTPRARVGERTQRRPPPPRVAAGDAPEADEGTNDAATGLETATPPCERTRTIRQSPTPSRRGDSKGERRVRSRWNVSGRASV